MQSKLGEVHSMLKLNNKIGFSFNNGVKLALGAMMLVSTLASMNAFAGKPKTMTMALSTEPPNLDSSKATDSESFFIIGHTMEGLTKYDEKGNTVPGVAEKWEITEKGATFHLRKDALWSDGKPVQAKDFVFSWRRALDPKTASEYAFILYHVKNAEQINQGKLPVDKLGVVAKDPQTLEVTFEKPCGYFLGLTAFATYLPLREDFVNQKNDKYASSPENLLFNGPFKLTQWVHGASLKMEKNDKYWAKNTIQLEVIDIPYITPDENARFNLFKTKKIDILGLGKDNLANAQREKFKLKKFTDGVLFYMSFNFRKGRLTANKNLRMALKSVFNPAEYVSRVVGIPGTLVATGLVPSWMKGEKQTFRKEFPAAASKPNIKEAKDYLAKAMKELNLKTPPSIVWLTTDSPLATKEAEYMQSVFKTTLGIDLKIDKQIFKQRLAKMKAGDFDIVSAGWGPDYADAMTYVDLFASWNGNNSGEWFNNDYDKHVRNAMNSVDPKVRMKEMASAEKILLEELPIIPMYERTIMYTHSDRVQGIVRNTIGPDPVLTGVKVVE